MNQGELVHFSNTCTSQMRHWSRERSSGCVVAWLLPSNRSSFRPFAALVGCSPVQVDPPPAHLWPTCISTCPHISNHTVEHFRRIFRQKKCEIKLICDLSGSCHRWPVVLYRQSKAAHLLCLDCDTCSRYDTLDLLIAPASLLQDASLILYQTTCKFLQDGVQKSSATVWAQAEPDFLVEAKREGEIFRGSCQLLLFRLHEGCHQVIASTFQPGCGCYFGSRLGCNQPFQLWIAILGWGLVVREVVGFSSCGSGWWLVVRDGQVREVNGDGVSRPVRIGRKHAQVFQPCNLFDLSHICTWGFRQFWHQFHPAQRSHEANTKLEEEFAHQLSHHLQPLQHPHHRSV